MAYGQIADSEREDLAFHTPDERGSNFPFHPVSLCGQTLTRDLVEEVPEGGAKCAKCSGTEKKADSKADSKDD